LTFRNKFEKKVTVDGFAVPADEEEEGMPPPPYDF